ncbi:hypothetical protein CEP51_012293 [Fusarium floridanum]|uniref:Protein kinase domain-containing protein n=1 Tax=Fusarium floridanum TaxID=1325733 RepID=A0A428QWU6_9HYPO|nr:hypothetical protein CEP51_012293 [Fusarium floridanum]
MGHQDWINSLDFPLEETAEPVSVELSSAWEKLSDACVESAMGHTLYQEFLPLGKLLSILSVKNVAELLRQEFPDHQEEFLHQVYDAEGRPKRLKIMGTLLLMGQLVFLRDFIKANVEDSQIPLRLKRLDGRPILYDRDEKRIPSDHTWSWDYHQAEFFTMKQMQLCSLFCTVKKEDPNAGFVNHFQLLDKAILPFPVCKNPETMRGGFGIVTKVKIEPSHLNYEGRDQKPEYFSVKTIRHDLPDHPDEAESLAKWPVIRERADREHLHRLLFSFRRAGRYHLVFEWADGDLKNFWQEMPSLYTLTCHDHVRCDIKPQNILWFKNYQDKKKDHLVIADLGLTQFNTTQSKSRVVWADVRGYTQTYKAPECDVEEHVGGKYDIWCIGRKEEDKKHRVHANFAGDVFYNLYSDGQQNDASSKTTATNQVQFRAEIKSTVKQWIKDLQAHERCSTSINNFLELIGKRMLIPDASQRKSAGEILVELIDIQKKCETDATFACSPKNAPLGHGLEGTVDNQHHHKPDATAIQSQYLAGMTGGQENPDAELPRGQTQEMTSGDENDLILAGEPGPSFSTFRCIDTPPASLFSETPRTKSIGSSVSSLQQTSSINKLIESFKLLTISKRCRR